jgi:hypothetical protein
MNSIKNCFLCLVGVIVFFAGCAKYKPHPLSVPFSVGSDLRDNKKETVRLGDDLNDIVEPDADDSIVPEEPEENGEVKAIAVPLTEGDCRYYFSRKILNKGYRPVQLCIKNGSDQKYIFNSSTINMPIEYRGSVASRLHLDTTQRVLGWGVAGIFFHPLLIPAVVECIKTPQANRSLDNDFDDRVIDINSRYDINPGAIFNKVFFVREDQLSDKLSFNLLDSGTKQVKKMNISL